MSRFKIYSLIAGVVSFLQNNPCISQSLSAERNYAINAPGVAMVQTVFSATVYVNKVEINEKRFRQLVDSVKRLDTTGNMLSASQKLDIVVKALYRYPFRYFSATTEYLRQQHRIVSEGTGFFITGDGYFITNCHVIDRDSAFIRQKFIQSTFQEVTDANIRSLQRSWAMTLSDEQRNLLYNSYSLIYSQLSSMILFDLKKDIYIIYRADNEINKPFRIKKQAILVIKGRAMPGKDVALLKLEDVKDLPTLQMSGDSVVRIGERILVYGYPEPATSNVFLAAESNSDPTLTSGIVSAIKQSVGGWPVVQMDAIISHGSSGSPVCDEDGHVIGLATFGSLEQNTGTLASGYNFAIPISVIQEYLDSARVQPKQSLSSQLYNEGLAFFYESFYNKALRKFEEVQKLNSNYPRLNYYEALCHDKIDAGEDKESFMQKNFFRIMALILFTGGIYIFYRWQKKKRETFHA
ncbi:MAG: trypsin-like peptidase domain-containing protein [Bacteroidetes bacterium]|jgi:serine protease Do|nr:MAG: trypsin-like peptidase domain-containing protein [Bacteroidota bacterium]